jgi:MYXO-CTERM domain-containing protein
MYTTCAIAFGLALAGTATAAPAPGSLVVSPDGRFASKMPSRPLANPLPVGALPHAASNNIIFMNRCTGGCSVSYGDTDSRTNKSDIGQGTLSAWSRGDTAWGQVMACMQTTFAAFNVHITDVDPGTTPHMEIMVAGRGGQIGLPSGVLGVADNVCQTIGQCTPFMPNALVFAFANDSYYDQTGPLDICSTAAQEIAHTWALDHVVDATDPMTYNLYSGQRMYKDGQKCGSDCYGGQSPFGLQCSGSNDSTATHTCMNGSSTQDEIQTILALFGSSAPDDEPPTVQITAPSDNGQVSPGFTVTATLADNQGIASAELTLDGVSIGVDNGAPYTWTTGGSLAMGSHHVVVIAKDYKGNMATDSVDVRYGMACDGNGDCPDTQVCASGVCIAGPEATGGLGTTCTNNASCASGVCGTADMESYCVTNCSTDDDQCPSGFHCLGVSNGDAGVCWPGEGDGGCSSTGGGNPGLLLFGLGALLVVRRRRR